MAKEKMLEFKRVEVMPLAKICSLFGLIVGIIVALVFAVMSGSALPMAGMLPNQMGIAAIIFLPIMYGVLYFIGGAISAVIYNVLASKIGGVKVTV